MGALVPYYLWILTLLKFWQLSFWCEKSNWPIKFIAVFEEIGCFLTLFREKLCQAFSFWVPKINLKKNKIIFREFYLEFFDSLFNDSAEEYYSELIELLKIL